MPARSATPGTLSGAGEWRHVLVYAPPGWAVFEVCVRDGEWKVNEFNSGVFRFDDHTSVFSDDLAADRLAMDEFVILCLRFPNARVYFEDEMGNERTMAWLEYALHRLRGEPKRIVLTREERDVRYSDERLERWGYTDTEDRGRDAIRLGIKAIAEWKAEG